MKTATVRQIRNSFPEVLRHVQRGESVAITSRRKVVATLAPAVLPKTLKKRRPWAGLAKRLDELRREPLLAQSGAALLSEDRERF